MFRSYPMPQKEFGLPQFFSGGTAVKEPCELYIGDEKVMLNAARVSAMPFNRWWPGHQRPEDQTEIAPFAAFASDSPVFVRVIPAKQFREAVVRPSSKGIIPRAENGGICFTLPGPGQYTLETDGTHGALHLFIDPEKPYDILPGGANVFYYGPGVHEPGLIELHSGQTLYIAEGAVVYGRVHAEDAENIRIIGRGILDSSKITEDPALELDLSPHFNVHDAERPGTIVLEYCSDILIDGVILRDPLFLALRPICCSRCVIDNVKIIGCWRYNSDGIDFLNCTDSAARNCFVRSFDDSLCIKGFFFLHQGYFFHNRRTYDVTDNVRFEHCVVWNDWGKALEVGVDLCAREIRNCAFTDCDIIHGTSVMLDVSNCDYAEVYDILFENIRVEYDPVIQPPVIQSADADAYMPDDGSAYRPALIVSELFVSREVSQGGVVRGNHHGLVFRDIHVISAAMPPSRFRGYDGAHTVRDVTVENLTLNGKRIGSLWEGNIAVLEYTDDIRLF